MPLSIKESKKRFSKVGGRLALASRNVAKKIGDKPLEIMLFLFLIANLFVSLKVLFGLFILLYFADRWNVKELITSYTKQPEVIKEEPTIYKDNNVED